MRETRFQTFKEPAIIVVIGPTASGKSEYAVRLAKKIGGEIISADSRQVYRGLDLGTGKVAGKWVNFKFQISNFKYTQAFGTRPNEILTGTKKVYTYKGIIHHCIDLVSPRRQYSVAEFQRQGLKAIGEIISRGHTPIICGGTGLYIDALIFQNVIPAVPPNIEFRKKMEQKTAVQLFAILQKQDVRRAADIDPHNKRRLVRALEIIHATGQPVPPKVPATNMSYRTYWSNDSRRGQVNPLAVSFKIYYLNPPSELLKGQIAKRLAVRLRRGMIKEVENLHKKGLSWKRMEELGLEYRYISRYLRGFISREEMIAQLQKGIEHYAKRQRTWMRKYGEMMKR